MKSVNFNDEAASKHIFMMLAKQPSQTHVPLMEREQVPLDSLVRLSSSSSNAGRVDMSSRYVIQAASALRQLVLMKQEGRLSLREHSTASGIFRITSLGSPKILLCVASRYWSHGRIQLDVNFSATPIKGEKRRRDAASSIKAR